MHSILGWTASLLVCFPLIAWSTTLTITAQRATVVQGPQITIGDVAEVHGGSPHMADKVRDIVIGQSPPAGR